MPTWKPFTDEELYEERRKVLMNDPAHDLRARFLATLAQRDDQIARDALWKQHANEATKNYILDLTDALVAVDVRDRKIIQLEAKLEGVMAQWTNESEKSSKLFTKLVEQRHALEAVRYYALAVYEMLSSLEHVNQSWPAIAKASEDLKDHIDNYDHIARKTKEAR